VLPPRDDASTITTSFGAQLSELTVRLLALVAEFLPLESIPKVWVALTKFAVMVPAPPMVAVVEDEDELANVIDVVFEFQDENL
jgi:hypothetical protein